MADAIPLRDARQRLGVSDSTIRRMIKRGTLHAETRDGPYGPEWWISSTDVEAQAKILAARRLPSPAPRRVEDLTLGELLAWADAPAVRVAFLQWQRTASVTPGTLLRWMRERLRQNEG